MLKVHSEPPKPKAEYSGPALFALGFRPFFLLAGVSAIALIVTWLLMWSGVIAPSSHYGFIGWHSHEMLFGYTAAIISGFLLAAVRNWTGALTPDGTPLMMLALLWIAGRLLPFFDQVIPGVVLSIVDLAFLPAVALAIRPALWQGQQKMNRIFVPLLLIMGIANLLVHLEALGFTHTAEQGLSGMLYLIVLLITLLGGRVIPFFTETAIPGHESKRRPALESAAMACFILLILEQLIFPVIWITGILALLVGITQSLRMVGWYTPQIWTKPILWVLYTGLGWIVVGMLMVAASSFNSLPINLAKHALTVGGIGILTFGMMARVALGHTGRPIEPNRWIVVGFVIMNLATFTRTIGPLIAENYTMWIHLSGTLWCLAFAIFCAVYIPMLIRPRADGKTG